MGNCVALMVQPLPQAEILKRINTWQDFVKRYEDRLRSSKKSAARPKAAKPKVKDLLEEIPSTELKRGDFYSRPGGLGTYRVLTVNDDWVTAIIYEKREGFDKPQARYTGFHKRNVKQVMVYRKQPAPPPPKKTGEIIFPGEPVPQRFDAEQYKRESNARLAMIYVNAKLNAAEELAEIFPEQRTSA